MLVQDASVIDSTGGGWLILHEKDVVDTFYKKDKKTDTGSLIATTVYTLKSEYNALAILPSSSTPYRTAWLANDICME